MEERKSCSARDLDGEPYLINLGGGCSQCCCVPAKKPGIVSIGSLPLEILTRPADKEGWSRARLWGQCPSRCFT